MKKRWLIIVGLFASICVLRGNVAIATKKKAVSSLRAAAARLGFIKKDEVSDFKIVNGYLKKNRALLSKHGIDYMQLDDDSKQALYIWLTHAQSGRLGPIFEQLFLLAADYQPEATRSHAQLVNAIDIDGFDAVIAEKAGIPIDRLPWYE